MKIKEMGDSMTRAEVHSIALCTLPKGMTKSAANTYELDVATVLDKAKEMSAEELGLKEDGKRFVLETIASVRRTLGEQLNS